MKFYFYVVFLLFIYMPMILAEDSILNTDQQEVVNNAIEVDQESVQEEIRKLSTDLDELKHQLSIKEDEKSKLKLELDSYKTNEAKVAERKNQIENFILLIEKDPFIIKEIVDQDYNDALQAIRLENIDIASKYLIVFLGKKNKYQADTNEQALTEQQQKDKEEEFKVNVQRMKDKANFLLGYINTINISYTDAIPYFASSYQQSEDQDLILLSLIGLMESFDHLNKEKEVCLTITRYYDSLKQIQNINRDWTWGIAQKTAVESLDIKYHCNKSQVKNQDTASVNPPAEVAKNNPNTVENNPKPLFRKLNFGSKPISNAEAAGETLEKPLESDNVSQSNIGAGQQG